MWLIQKVTVVALEMLDVQLTCFPWTIGDNLEGMKVHFSETLMVI